MAGASLISLLIIIYGIVLLIALAMAVLQIIATWKLYEKAGEPGWSSIVPVYYYMQQVKIATGSYMLGWVYLGLTVVYTIACYSMLLAGLADDNETAMLIMVIVMIICLIIIVPICIIAGYISYMFAKSYGKSLVFCVLSIFFPQIMIIIMGFDKSTQYVGPKGIPQYKGYI